MTDEIQPRDASAENDEESATTRRSCCAALGGLAAGSLLLSGASSTARAASFDANPRYDYDRVIDVTDVGADNTGSEPITPILKKYAKNNTLLKFPAGRYRMDEQFRRSNFKNLGFVGNDATIVPDDYYSFDGISCFKLGTYYSPGRNLQFEGFTFDNTAPDTGVRAIQAQMSDGMFVSDVDYLGVHDSGRWGPALFDIVDPDGSGTVRNFRAPHGAEFSVNTPGSIDTGPTGMLVTRYHEGDLTLYRNTIVGFPDNGLYAGNANGTVSVVSGLYQNNNVSNVRIGGDGSNVRWASIVVDENRPEDENQVGIRLDAGNDLLVDAVRIQLDRPTGDGLIVRGGVGSATIRKTNVSVSERPALGIKITPAAGPTTISDVNVDLDVSTNALYLAPKDTSRGGGDVVCDGLTVTGTASGSPYRNAVRCSRAGTQFRGLSVDQNGDDYRRALGLFADDCTVTGGTFYGSHHPIVVGASGTVLENVDHAESYDGFSAVKIYDGSSNTVIRDSTLVNGVTDAGSSTLLQNNTLL